MYCSNCGAERVESSGAFCRVCGFRRTPDPKPQDEFGYRESSYPDYSPASFTPTPPSFPQRSGAPSSAPTPWRSEPNSPVPPLVPHLGPTPSAGALAARPLDQTRLLVLIGVAVLVLAAGFGLGYLVTGMYLPAS